MRGLATAMLLLCAAGCDRGPMRDEDVPPEAFPAAHRPVAPIVSSRYSTEDRRDRLGEADAVMAQAGIAPGMTVADIGAGEGYYTIRLAARVGAEGRVVAQDIVPAVRDRLAERVTRENLENVSVKLGAPADPKLPAHSFDRVFMVHMYHEIRRPYEFLWRLRPALTPRGIVVVVEAERPSMAHGMPARQLDCEFRAVGYQLVSRQQMPMVDGYLALYAASDRRPEPAAITPCLQPD